ncbi:MULTISPECIES: L-threonylcarbamoyladenylate synthase [Chryseobacterium]|uniref:Threonylcarbamoyl-AMP synthase n=1 Tax=Chryseobacterium taihuense TaxID=1141221 RepID=A0A4U8WFU3_9FLAO|nr:MULTISPECIES: L-threonylcarbamoyladenylate synthase [Chryseobacterium]QQV02158.1 threonylcarbamoyl-AMP synthase [Chryseobacterium sp. FDAARGOS 1104]VFB04606.1 t(6)A37 threonylcarbamoyladenosine biosynthesis protein RimN [Chryseobacterium taihuense]
MITKDIQKAIEALQNDELIALPTETVYGLAANAYNETAIKKIFELKKRPLYNPLIVHLHSKEQLKEVAKEIPEKAKILAEKFWPGSLTLVLKKQNHIPDLVTAGKDTVAVRVPQHLVALALLEQLDFPLVAPSANPFGSISPTSAKHVWNYFQENLPVILDGGDCSNGVESTIIGFQGDEAVLYRHGSVSVEEIEQVIGKIEMITRNDTTPDAPGMLSKHYAPKTKIILTENIENEIQENSGKRIGALIFKNQTKTAIAYQEVLSAEGDLKEASKNLYAALHRLDAMDLDIIIAERLPDSGLGITINDRLNRATKK